MGSPYVRTSVIYNAVDIDSINSWRADSLRVNKAVASLQERGYPVGKHPIILTVAGLARHKGIQKVIRAMPEILSELLTHATLWQEMVCTDLNSNATVKDALAPHLRHTVIFLGRVSDTEKYACYDMSDVFAMPSEEEGFGLVYVEAAAFGKPAVGCDVMGIPEAVSHGETGLLVNPEDVDAVEKAILRLLRMMVNACVWGRTGGSAWNLHLAGPQVQGTIR